MKTIPLTRARHARNFAVALKDKGEASAQLLDRARLQPEFLDSIGRDGVISAIKMLDFAETAAWQTGILDLGFWAGSVPIEEYGTFGKHVTSSPNLHSAILTFCREVPEECSEANYFLTLGKTSAWFCHGPVSSNMLQHELYAMMIIIQVIQQAMGSDWKPVNIRLQSEDDSLIRDNDFLLGMNIEFGAPITAVEFPLGALIWPLRQPSNTPYTNGSETAEAFIDKFPGEPTLALKKLIASHMRQSQQPSIEHIAEIAGMSKRTLQRVLSRRSTTYSRLIEQVRLDLALPLMANAQYSITDISAKLGYANIAHFSRAFKRQTGLAPRTYRQRLKL